MWGRRGRLRGVPPGHCKDPILFNIQANDLEDSRQVRSKMCQGDGQAGAAVCVGGGMGRWQK